MCARQGYRQSLHTTMRQGHKGHEPGPPDSAATISAGERVSRCAKERLCLSRVVDEKVPSQCLIGWPTEYSCTSRGLRPTRLPPLATHARKAESILDGGFRRGSPDAQDVH
jgi:hypothetical protein